MVTKILLNKKTLFIFSLLSVGIAAAVFANSPYDITFPIPELGNCANKSACKAYCDISGSADVQQKLPKTELNQKQGDWNFRLRVFGAGSRYQLVIQNNNGIGPFSINQGDGTLYTAGNPPSCKGFQVYSTDQGRLPEQLPFNGMVTDCKTGEKTSFQIPAAVGGLNSSEKLERQNQCDAFAVKHNLGNAQERTQKLAAVEADGGPGGCARSENPYDTCNIYCSLVDHMEECVNYAKTHAGVMSEEELRDADKVTAALRSGAKLPDFCANDMRSCKDKCMTPASAEVARQCFTFAKAAGLAPQDVSVDDMEKMFGIMSKRGLSFKDMEKCEQEISEVCIDVGIEAGFIKPAEAKMIKATGGKGPGGCRGREACESFCNNEANQETCANFMSEVLEKNPDLNIEEMIPEKDRARMQEGLGQMRAGLNQAPEAVKTCLEKTFPGIVNKVEAGNLGTAEMMKVGPKMGKVIQQCFQEAFSSGAFPGAPGEFPGGGGHEGFPGTPGGFPGKPGEFPGGQGGGPNLGPGVQECFAELGIAFPPKGPLVGDQEAQMRSCVQKRFAPGPDADHGPGESGDRSVHEGSETPEGGGRFPDGFNRHEGGEFQPKDFQRQFPGGNLSPEELQKQFPGGAPNPEQLQQFQKQQLDQQFQQEYQKQYQQEYQQQFQQPQIQPLEQQPLLQPQSKLSPPSLGDFLGNIIFGLLLSK